MFSGVGQAAEPCQALSRFLGHDRKRHVGRGRVADRAWGMLLTVFFLLSILLVRE